MEAADFSEGFVIIPKDRYLHFVIVFITQEEARDLIYAGSIILGHMLYFIAVGKSDFLPAIYFCV
jgi:hypothetical protein